MTTTSKVLALSFAAALLSAPFAASVSAATNSATTHATTTRHHTARPVHSTSRAARATTNPDNSADSLNAQSLARSRGQQ